MKRTTLALSLGAAMLLGHTAGAATYEVDAEQSQLSFFYQQMGVGLEGGFQGLSGEIEYEVDQPEQMAARIELPLNTVDTGNDDANEELEKPEWFDLSAYPTASFVSNEVTPAGEGSYQVNGQLHIKGEDLELTIPVTVGENEAGALVFETEFSIDRSDFDIGSGTWSDPSIVANEVTIKAAIVALPQD